MINTIFNTIFNKMKRNKYCIYTFLTNIIVCILLIYF